MKKLWLTLLGSVFLCASVYAATVSMIVGANVEAPAPVFVLGVCGASDFSMTNAGTFLSVDETTFITLGIASAENGGSGFGYVTTRTSGSDTRLTKIGLPALTNESSSLINVADSPDTSTLDKGNFYNTFTSRFTVAMRQTTGVTCGGTVCLQIRDYSNAVLVNDVVTAAGSSSGADYGPTFDSTHTFIAYSIAGGSNLGKFVTGSYAFADNVFIPDSNVVTVSGVAVDDTYVYAPQNVSFRILRYLKANMSAGVIGFTPGLTDTFQIPSISTDGFLYIPTRSGGLSSNIMYRVRTSDMTITGQVNLGATQFLGRVLIDEVNDKLYLSVASGDFQNQIVRVNRTTLAIEATYSGVGQTNGPRTQYSQIDVPHQRIYVPINGSGAGDVSKVEEVKLCTTY